MLSNQPYFPKSPLAVDMHMHKALPVMPESGIKSEPLVYFQLSLCMCLRGRLDLEQSRVSTTSRQGFDSMKRSLKSQRREVILLILGTVIVRGGQEWRRVNGVNFLW